MATKGKPGKNVRLEVSKNSGYVLIAEVLTLNGVPEQADAIDVTSQDSSVGEFISSGVPKPQAITAEVIWVVSDPGQIEMKAALHDGSSRDFRLLFADNATSPTSITFSGVVIGMDGPSVAVGEAMKYTLTIQRSGAYTITRAPN